MDTIFLEVYFGNNRKFYFFSTTDNTIKAGDYVLVETIVGKQMGKVNKVLNSIGNFNMEIKPILSKATEQDIKQNAQNAKMAENTASIFRNEVKNLDLDMRLISCEYTFDRMKVLFIYASDERIDFRELLKVLASQLHCRIELKQINSRERAQMIGGIGVCGLPLCCTTFFTTFEGISLNRAKNQMLAINIPKLSGICGKLMCCLKYEDDLYTELKKDFPKTGTRVTYDGKQYRLSSYNVLTKTCKIEADDNVEFVQLSDLKIN
ncbi:MAG: regulatory iron-sulfur-containing complex subunit RicT [Bacilli bacterium]